MIIGQVKLLKKILPLLIAIFTASIIVIAFDSHVIKAFSTCPICKAKITLNGTQNPTTVVFYPAVTCNYAVKQSFGIIIPISLCFENKAPPAHHHS
ncbi:MAG: hypothetical protein WCI64_10970 [Chlorobium sp.]